MIRAKNYETVSKFVKVMTKILWPLFSGHGVYNYSLRHFDMIPGCDGRTDGRTDERTKSVIALLTRCKNRSLFDEVMKFGGLLLLFYTWTTRESRGIL